MEAGVAADRHKKEQNEGNCVRRRRPKTFSHRFRRGGNGRRPRLVAVPSMISGLSVDATRSPTADDVVWTPVGSDDEAAHSDDGAVLIQPTRGGIDEPGHKRKTRARQLSDVSSESGSAERTPVHTPDAADQAAVANSSSVEAHVETTQGAGRDRGTGATRVDASSRNLSSWRVPLQETSRRGRSSNSPGANSGDAARERSSHTSSMLKAKPQYAKGGAVKGKDQPKPATQRRAQSLPNDDLQEKQRAVTATAKVAATAWETATEPSELDQRLADRTREKLWARLFGNLECAVDDLYHMVEYVVVYLPPAAALVVVVVVVVVAIVCCLDLGLP